MSYVLESRRILLRELKLWVPMLQIGVPVYAYGFDRGVKAIGPGYSFDVAPQYDSWLVPTLVDGDKSYEKTDGERGEGVLLMPIATAGLYAWEVAPGYEDKPDIEKCFNPVKYPQGTRFSRCFSEELGQYIIQLYVPTFRHVEEYTIKTYAMDRVWYEGFVTTSE